MNTLSIPRCGLAFGGAFAILNFISVVLISIFGPRSLEVLLSVIFHGLHLSSIIAPKVEFWMAAASIISFFVIGGILGMLIAVIYNATAAPKRGSRV